MKETLGLPIITDLHDASQAEAVAAVADIIQIPAFLCRQTDLIVAAARTGRVIQIKKGQFCAPSVMRNSADKARWAGARGLEITQPTHRNAHGHSGILVYLYRHRHNAELVGNLT